MSMKICTFSTTALAVFVAIYLTGCEGEPRKRRVCKDVRTKMTFTSQDCGDDCSNTTIQYKWQIKAGGDWTDAGNGDVEPCSGEDVQIGPVPWTFIEYFTFRKDAEFQAQVQCPGSGWHDCGIIRAWPNVEKKLKFSKHPECDAGGMTANMWADQATKAMRDDDGEGDEGATDDVMACITWGVSGGMADFTSATDETFNHVNSGNEKDVIIENEKTGNVLVVDFIDNATASTAPDISTKRFLVSFGPSRGVDLVHEIGHLVGQELQGNLSFYVSTDPANIMVQAYTRQEKELNLQTASAIRQWAP